MKCKLCFETISYKDNKIKNGYICRDCYDMQLACVKNNLKELRDKEIFGINTIIHKATSNCWFRYGEFKLSNESICVKDWEISLRDVEAVRLDFQPLYQSRLCSGSVAYGNIILEIETKHPHIVIREIILSKDVIYSISGRNIFYKFDGMLQTIVSMLQKNLHNQVYNARSIYNYFKQQEEDAKREEERKAKQRQYKQNTRNSRHEKHRERTCSENKLALEEAMKTLGISKPFTIEQLKKIRKQLAVKYHPDQGGSVEMCAKINAAFDLLKDHVAA
ncbi:MAG: hypothetical protein IKJ73_07775 [Lachnospiraceae bacterium]|nr:hypothetical protein [Lachnospiraceae bacterium]